MTPLSPGQRLPIKDLCSSESAFDVELNLITDGAMEIDYACFGLDDDGKLSDDRYMTFFNQPHSPCGGVVQSASNRFSFDLTKIPDTIQKFSITASIDGAGSMNSLSHDRASKFSILDGGITAGKCEFTGQNFEQQKALMVVDIYKKSGVWRMAVNLQGFIEGLPAIVRHFGGEVASDDTQTAPPAPAPVSLEKRISDQAPALVSLAKKATVSLEKKGLSALNAKVGLVLDASGSLNGQYRKGRVQEVIDRLLPLAVHFDDDGELDCWAFGEKTQQEEPD